MKKLLTAIIFLLSLSFSQGQITLEHTYQGGDGMGGGDFFIVHFSANGYKYAVLQKSGTSGTLTLYNLNHSLWKIISIPAQPSGELDGVRYISDSLFNTTTSDIEYAALFTDANSVLHIRVYNDAGSLLLSRDTIEFGGNNLYPSTVSYTPNGYKMILEAGSQTNLGADTLTYLYSLPGALPCDECANGVLIGGIAPMSGSNNSYGYLSNPYPNPSSHSTTINYQLPDGENSGQLIFYDLQGKEIKRFSVDRTFNSINLTTTDLAAGTYLFVLQTGNGNVGSKKMVVIK